MITQTMNKVLFVIAFVSTFTSISNQIGVEGRLQGRGGGGDDFSITSSEIQRGSPNSSRSNDKPHLRATLRNKMTKLEELGQSLKKRK